MIRYVVLTNTTNIYVDYLCRFIGKLYSSDNIPVNLSEICIILHETFWIEFKPDEMIMKSSPHLQEQVVY